MRHILAFCVALVVGCAATPRPLTDQDVQHYGSITLDLPKERVMDLCMEALRQQGYQIDVAEGDTGLIVVYPRQEQGQRFRRGYVVEVVEDKGRVVVTAWPAVSDETGSRRMADSTWWLDEELQQWDRLFAEVRKLAAH